MNIQIAQIKVYPKKRRLKANHRRLMSILEAVAEYKPDVVVTPECFLDGYVATEDSVTRGDISSYGIDPTDSPYTREISGWASRSHSWFILGCTRLALEGAYNSALVFNREGHLVGMYDKVHCQTQDKKYLPGNRLPVFQSDFGLFGVMICADRRWAETVRTLALKGARVIFNPAYGMHDERNLRMMQTRSYESEVFIVFTHPGQSLITGPTGEVVCNQGAEETTFTICEINLARADRVRSGESSHLRDRRPDVYEL